MAIRTVLVVGAAGDVGQGIVAEALDSGRRVVAAGRDAGKLDRIAARFAGGAFACIVGDLASEAGARQLWDDAVAAFGAVDEVVISVNAPGQVRTLETAGAEDLRASFDGNVLPHFIAAKVILPRLPGDGMMLGIGGGTADFVFPGMVPMSMSQAALRMFYRGLAKERKTGAQLRELMIVSMVSGESNRDKAPAEWVTDADVGRHVCAILDAPERFSKPILHLRSREQAGQPEAEK
jgi:NAD(P)-dependent dehydrogenase (short-subunit alcohol dehydrogenase family)